MTRRLLYENEKAILIRATNGVVNQVKILQVAWGLIGVLGFYGVLSDVISKYMSQTLSVFDLPSVILGIPMIFFFFFKLPSIIFKSANKPKFSLDMNQVYMEEASLLSTSRSFYRQGGNKTGRHIYRAQVVLDDGDIDDLYTSPYVFDNLKEGDKVLVLTVNSGSDKIWSRCVLPYNFTELPHPEYLLHRS